MSSVESGQDGEPRMRMFGWGMVTRKKFELKLAANVAHKMHFISGQNVLEGEQKWWFERALAMAAKKHFDERIEGEEQEMEIIERATTMAIKILQSYCPLPVKASLEIGGSTARARGYVCSQTVFLDNSGGPFVSISINNLQQGDHGVMATARNGKDDPGKVVQNALVSAFGGVVVLCFSTLDNTLKDNCPEYIRAATYAGLVVITGSTVVGLVSKKRTKAAFKVMASAAVAAVSTAVVFNVSENVYIKATCGVLGAVATFATAAIDW